MDSTFETQEYKGYKIEVMTDQWPDNPMHNWSMIGQEAVLGRNEPIRLNADLLLSEDELYDEDADDELTLTEYLMDKKGAVIVVPYKLYDNRSQGMSLEEVDDSQVTPDGAFYLTEEDLKREFGNAADAKERAYKGILADMKIQNMYYNGDVFGYAVMDGDNVLDSVWGFYGRDFEENGLLKQARDFIDFWQKRRESGLCPQCGERPEYLMHVYEVQTQHYHDGPRGASEMNGPERFECPRCRYVIAKNGNEAEAFLKAGESRD
jgi:hypothetical protein